MINPALTQVTPVDSYSGFSLKKLFGKKKKKEELSPVDLEIKRIQGNIKASQQEQQLAQTQAAIKREQATSSIAITVAVAAAAGLGLWYYHRRMKHAK